MGNIIKKNGYVYLVEGANGFQTFYNLGKDPDDQRWNEEVEDKPKKANKKKEKTNESED